MYVGRIVVIGRTKGRSWVGYRVSSRSFPNRRASVRGDSVLVSPRDPKDLERNPYIAYNCIRIAGDAAVVANGTQADMIAEKIKDGTRPLEAIAFSLTAYGYERDEMDTPRIAGVVVKDRGWLGIAMKGEIRTKEFDLSKDAAVMVATYEKTEFETLGVAGESAEEVAKAAFDLSFELPVCSAAAFEVDDGFGLGVYNPGPD
ncbi:MAG TPA: IMP cyclohydrolase [Methanothrix sp.]|nr:IMP cyclohydrolase [Methanothrix sp.]HRW83711.1 IMP cyclohydrolase [Methanothrix sp.]